MNALKAHIVLLLVALMGFSTGVAGNPATELRLLGSTPGDHEIKMQLGIDPGTAIDFIKWNLALTDDDKNLKEFTLDLQFGLAQPNTTGFINGGKRLSLKGTYTTISKKFGEVGFQVYRLRSASSAAISFVRINENVFHILSSDNSLMLGNGGWSYSLNRDGGIKTSDSLKSFIPAAFSPADTSTKIIFEARTPCMEIAKDSRLSVSEDCFKLKWKFIMERDATTLQPTRYTIERTDKRTLPIKGRWSTLKGNAKHPDAIIYRLEPEDGNPVIHMLAVDYDVIFFLDKELNLFVGNQENSYTANKRRVK